MKANTKNKIKLFRARSVLDGLLYRETLFDGIVHNWFVCDREPSVVAYSEAIQDYEENFEDSRMRSYSEFAVDELFTASEVAALKYYLLAAHGVECEVEEVDIPIPLGASGYNSIPVGGLCDFYMLYKTESYDLPFKVMGYYDIDDYMDTLYDFVAEILEGLDPQKDEGPTRLLSCCAAALHRGWRIRVSPPEHK